jgi:hypothetical protein
VSSIRSISSSFDATYQYRDIAPARTSRAMRRMLASELGELVDYLDAAA